MPDKSKYQIGQRVWLYDSNNSKYDPGPHGRKQILVDLDKLGVRWKLGGTERQYSVEQLEAVAAILKGQP